MFFLTEQFSYLWLGWGAGRVWKLSVQTLIYFGFVLFLSNCVFHVAHNMLCLCLTGHLNREGFVFPRDKQGRHALFMFWGSTSGGPGPLGTQSKLRKEVTVSLQSARGREETHPSAPLCLEERLARRRPDERWLRTPCLGLQCPCAQSSSLGWWWTAENLWSLLFLEKNDQKQTAEEH